MTKRRLQFSLRTCLALMIVLGIAPWVFVHYQRWRETRLWRDYHAATVQRDELLHQWRLQYVTMTTSAHTQTASESTAREAYFEANKVVEEKSRAIQAYYAESPSRLEAASRKFRRQGADVRDDE